MWRKLAILAGVAGALLFVLLAPMTTVTVKVDLPPGAQHVSASQVGSAVEGFVWIVDTMLVMGVLGIAAFIGWRIVRHHRISH